MNPQKRRPDTKMCEACTDDCAICLADCCEPVELKCSHRFCRKPCFLTYAIQKHSARQAVTCPICTAALSDNELKLALLSPDESLADRPDLADVLSSHNKAASRREIEFERREQTVPRIDRNADKAFAAWASRNHIKRCSHCSAPIQKNGGCIMMTCGSCKLGFRWDAVPVIAPCAGWHYRKAFPFVSKCPHARWQDLPMSSRGWYYLHVSCAYAPIAVAALPCAVAVSPYLAARRIKKDVRAWERARALRELEQRRREMCAAMYREIESKLCRNTNQHEWVAGWCCRCGATNEGWLAWERDLV